VQEPLRVILEQALDIALDKTDLKRKRVRWLEREEKWSGETPSENLVQTRFSREQKGGGLLALA